MPGCSCRLRKSGKGSKVKVFRFNLPTMGKIADRRGSNPKLALAPRALHKHSPLHHRTIRCLDWRFGDGDRDSVKFFFSSKNLLSLFQSGDA